MCLQVATDMYKEEEYIIISSITVNNFVLKSVHPDNIVLLSNNNILKVDAILLKKKDTANSLKLQDLYVQSYQLTDSREAFNYPMSSKEFGIFVGKKFSESKEIFALKNVRSKCILLHNNNIHYVISLLHTF